MGGKTGDGGRLGGAGASINLGGDWGRLSQPLSRGGSLMRNVG